jgi:carboxymethylenebutenolidase
MEVPMRLVPTLIALLALASSIVPEPAAAARVGPPPPAEETAAAALETTPRHAEWVDVPLASGTPIRTFVVFPERKDKAGVVVIIHEIYGLSPWIRGVADAFAREGFIAVAPDLISGMGPGGGGSDSVASRDELVKLIRGLSRADAEARIGAVRTYAAALPASNGKVGTVGFCWGGARSFEQAATRPAPQGCVVYYGASPDSATLLQVSAPVLGLYGGDDARVNATVDPARAALEARKARFDPHVFPGAGHGFLRQQTAREGANQKAADQAWPLTIDFLRRQLR